MSEIENIDITFKQVNRDILKGWIVYYWINNELIKYSSETHDWVDLPKIGVQCMYRVYDTYKEQVIGHDYYCPFKLNEKIDLNLYIKFGLYLDDNIFHNNVMPIIKEDLNKMST